MKIRLAALGYNLMIIFFIAAPADATTSLACERLFSPTPPIVSLYRSAQTDAQLDPQILANQANFSDLIRLGGGGACAPSAAFNLLVGIRKMLGIPEYLNADKVLRHTYEQMPDLRDGRVSNNQLKKIISSFQKYVQGRRLQVRIDRSFKHRDDWHESKHDGAVTWKRFNYGILLPQGNEIKLLTYRVKNPEGKLLGRHFVVLLEFDPNQRSVSVLDSNRPDHIFHYTLVKVLDEDGYETVELNRLPNGDRGYNNRLDSVITVKY